MQIDVNKNRELIYKRLSRRRGLTEIQIMGNDSPINSDSLDCVVGRIQIFAGRLNHATERDISTGLRRIATSIGTPMSQVDLCIARDLLLVTIVKIEQQRPLTDAASLLDSIYRICRATTESELKHVLLGYLRQRTIASDRVAPPVPHRIAAVPLGTIGAYATGRMATPSHEGKDSNGRSGGPDRRVIRAITFIQDHYASPELVVSSVAAAVRLSRWHLERMLRQYIGSCFRDYLLRLRMEEAIKLLKDDRLSIKEISTKVGYMSVSAFSRRFTHYTGASPRGWRNRFVSTSVTHLPM